jgi:hypothetical protein
VAQFERAAATDMTDHRDRCLKRAATCRKQAELQPEKRKSWLEAAAEWDRRAEEIRGRSAVTHEVHKGRMIAKPTH